MRGWLKKQGSRFVLSLVTSVALVIPSISSAEVLQESPSSMAMMGDAIVVRPLLVVATVAGTAIFLVTLPFTILGDNVDEAQHVLVEEPGKALFHRCLGCTGQQDEARDQQRAELEKEQAAVDAAAAAATTK